HRSRHHGYAQAVTDFRITVDASSSVPLNEQLTTGIQDAVKAGQLAPGTKLPTVRALAAELGVATYTVARAYRQLEDLGVIETPGRNGTLVSTFGDATQQQAQLAARAYADRIHSLGVPSKEALALAKAALEN